MEVEAQHLLVPNDEKTDDTMVYARHPSKYFHWWSPARPLITHGIVAILVLVAVKIFYHIDATNPRSYPQLYSPLQPVIEYTVDVPPRAYWSNDMFFGPPSEKSEIAWNKLIYPHGLQVYQEELKHFDTSKAVVLKNGNHLFILGVHHNLHCLRRIRQTLQADHYYPNMTEEQRKQDHEHTNHCLEALRTSMLCHPDLTTNGYYWSNHTQHDLSVRPDMTRECVNWDRIRGFMKSRAYDPADILKYPDADLEE